MSFTTIYNSQSADNDVLNNNFYALAQGTIYPRGGTNLDPTTSAYSLGDSTHRWINLNANSFKTDTPPENLSGYKFFDEKILSLNITSAVSRIEITGINGDAQDQAYYHVMCNINITDHTGGMAFYCSYNTSTLDNKSHFTTFDLSDSLLYSGYGESEYNQIFCSSSSTTEKITYFFYMRCYLPTGDYRTSFITARLLESPYTYIDNARILKTNSWRNYTTTVTSLNFDFPSGMTGHITVWRHR